MPDNRSEIGTPTLVGVSGSGPVIDISPPSPWAIWSYPARPPSGPSCPKPEMDSTTRPGLSCINRASGKPNRSSTPGRKFSHSTSQRRISSVSASFPAGDLRSSVTDCLLRLQDRK